MRSTTAPRTKVRRLACRAGPAGLVLAVIMSAHPLLGALRAFSMAALLGGGTLPSAPRT